MGLLFPMVVLDFSRDEQFLEYTLLKVLNFELPAGVWGVSLPAPTCAMKGLTRWLRWATLVTAE